VFKSTDGAGTWSTADTGLPTATSVNVLVIDTSNPTTLYAGTCDYGVGNAGLFKSTDSGGSWSPANSGLTEQYICALAIDPNNSATLYAGTYYGVFKSIDGGGNWSPANTGIDTRFSITTLAIDPANPNTLYAGTSGGVFKSTDGGGNWSSPANSGLSGFVDALAIDPANPATLYAGTSSDGVFKSTDGGGSWSPANTGLPNNTGVSVLAIDPTNPATLYAGVLIYAGGTTSGGVFKSSDGGVNWSPANSGLPAGSVSALAIDPVNSATVYAGHAGYAGVPLGGGRGVFKSTDGGKIWSPANSGLTATSVFAQAIDPDNPATLYAGTSGGVFKSTDGGGSWNLANSGLPVASVSALSIDPANSATLYAAYRGFFSPSGGVGGVFKSSDGGVNWNPANSGLPEFVYALAIDPVNPATLYAGAQAFEFRQRSYGIFKSTDGGGSWRPASSGLPWSTYVNELAIDPANPATVYAGTGGGLFKSTDGGGSWSQAYTGLPATSVSALSIDPANPATLYAGTIGGGVFKSIDGGGSWSPAKSGLPATNVYALAIDPVNSAMLYAGTDGGGVFKSIDGGGVWSPINASLPTASVHALAIDPTNPSTLYAGTPNGVFKFPALTPTECLFNWAEKTYPALFAPAGSPTAAWTVYTYRHYPATNSYLGVSSIDNHVYFMGTDGYLQDEGPLSDWLHQAGCQVPTPPPIECLFNWAENNYPAPFAPSGSPTAIWGVYTYRYYSATNAYLGVSSTDNHVYYLEPNGNLQDEGLLSYWLPKTGCQ
jgi:photosystem II stability/assembly factor-like uncharacterized protein